MLRVRDVIKDVPENKKTPNPLAYCNSKHSSSYHNNLIKVKIYNETIREILNSEVDVEICRDKLGRLLYENEGSYNTWDSLNEITKELYREDADFLIQNKSVWLKGKVR